MRKRSGARSLAAVLFTDIVDSTTHAAQIGDRRWKELIGRHHAIVRRELKRFGGRELDTAGDGFFASFTEPAAAIRCACAASEAVRQLGIEIRAGVHFGECEQVGSKLGGLTVVVGARVMSLGGAGDVLTTGSTRELIGGAELGFGDRGRHALKGVDGEWQVFAVTDVDGAPRPGPIDADQAEQRLAAIQPTGALRRTPSKLVALIAAFVVVVAVIAVPPLLRKGGSEIAPNSVGVVDLSSGELSDTIPMPSRPGEITSGNGSLWVTNPDAETVTRIDGVSKAAINTIPVGGAPAGIVAGEGAIWVVESGGPSVSRISPETNTIVDTIPVGNGPVGVAVGEGAIWVTNRIDGTVSKVDPEQGEVVKTIPVGVDPSDITVAFGSVWVANAGSNDVVRIDPDTDAVTQSIGVGNGPVTVESSDDGIWVANGLDDTVSLIDPGTNKVAVAIPVGEGPSDIAFAEEAVWVANESAGTLSRIDLDSKTVGRTVRTGSIPSGLVAADGSLWVTVRGTATSHRGGTLRLVSETAPSTLDPANAYSTPWQIMTIVGDGLVGFKRVGGVDGGTLVPDLAVALPSPTDGGRTYAFELRPGIAYSNGEIVVASDFRLGIERAFRISGDTAKYFFGGLVGGRACSNTPTACDLSEGIVSDDQAGTVVFHLVKPDPELLYKLALPFGFPVPPSTPDEEQGRMGVPGTGPYMLDGPMTHDGLALVRNEHFRQWSVEAQPDGNVARIEWTFGGTSEEQVDGVANGEADYMVEFAPFPLSDIEDLRVRFAAQVYEHPFKQAHYLFLNTTLPPFDKVDVRRALNLAIDRQRIVELYGGPAAARLTCQILPPNFPGYEPYCPYTTDPGPGGQWTGPDFEQAMRLVQRSGTAGTHVTLWYSPSPVFPAEPAVAKYFVRLMDELGFVADLRSTTDTIDEQLHLQAARNAHFEAILDLSRGIQIADAAWTPDYFAASNFITPLLMCDSFLNYGSFCDPEIDAMTKHAVRIQTEDPAASGEAWAEVDHAITDQAPWVPLVNLIDVDFVSKRLQNYQYNPQWGLLLGQVWVR
jgi:peptide/nickel transport system substrate-binding protein